MPAPAWEDLGQFFDTDDFATTAIFVNADALPSGPVPGIYDDPYMDKQLGEYTQDASEPRFTCQARHVAAVKKHNEVTIASMPGRKYAVLHDPKFDGTGTCVIYLARTE